MPTAAILGVSGYSGQETLDRVLRHPGLEVAALGSDSLAGETASALDVRLNGSLPRFVPNADAPGAWSYGLPELYAPEGNLIANPGCYATAALLALAPLADAVDAETVVIDGKSGISGAGRELKTSSHAGFVLENLSPYAVGAHRHAPEIAQQLGFPVTFVPHLLPVRRGLLATCYVHTDADARELLESAYAASPVVRVLPEGVTPELARVQGTDAAEIGIFTDASTGTTI